MNPIPDRIVEFINEHHIFSLATVNNNQPWQCTCFYVFDQNSNSLIFTTDLHTRHAKEMIENKKVGGAIALETKSIGKIRGIQIEGDAKHLEGKEKSKAKLKYLKAFPYAILAKTAMWKLEMKHIKMTDNRLGFGKKLIWETEKI